MSFLPYARSAPSGWWLAGSGSAFVHAGLIGLAIAGGQGLITLAATPPPEPKYNITMIPLNSDTIAGPVLQEGEVGADGTDGPDAITAVPAAEKLTARVAETAPASPSTAERLDTIDAQRAREAQALQPTAPTLDTPQIINPLVSEILAPNAGKKSGQPEATVQPVRPNTTATTITPLRPETPLAPATQAAQTAQTAAPSAQDLAITDLLRRIRTAPPEPCFLALPRRDGETGVGLALISSSEAAIDRFNQAVLTAEDTDLRQTRTFVDERQCAALDYIRQNQDYPATRLGLQLDVTRVPSGGRLQGQLRGTTGRYLTLLLIDNNGVVQDLQRFVSYTGNLTRFDIPVTRAGASRDTGQILLAIATPSPASILRDRAGRLADDVFMRLTDPLASKAALGVATFDVDVR